TACVPYEWAPRQIFLVTGLLADHDDARMGGPLAEHRLGAALPEIAPAAGRGRRAQGRQRPPRRHEVRRRSRRPYAPGHAARRCTFEAGGYSAIPWLAAA